MEPSGGRRGVNAFVQRYEAAAEGLEFLEQYDQMAEVASKPVQSPADRHVDLAAACGLYEFSSAGRRSFAAEMPRSQIQPPSNRER